MRPRLLINHLSRTLRNGERESLKFELGVNVLVGAQNTGKSTWLRMLDYLMLDDSSASNIFDEVIIEKYQAVSADMWVGRRRLTLERQWNEDGSRSATFVDEERMSLTDVEDLFFELLEIPLLRYPQGAIFTNDRTWPTLGWRSLFRHIYRRQDFWSDLVPKQPDSEQHACLLQFLGMAEKVFSDELAQLVDKRRQIARAESRRDFFFELVQQIAPSLFSAEEFQAGVTESTIASAIARLDTEINELVTARSIDLAAVREHAGPTESLMRAVDRQDSALRAHSNLTAIVKQLQERSDQLVRYRATLQQELARLERADAAAAVFAGLRITHCPACDQTVQDRGTDGHHCFLCSQQITDQTSSSESGIRRLNFEKEQIAGELSEANELIAETQTERRRHEHALERNRREVAAAETALRPFQAAASALVPASIALKDQRIGALGSRKEDLDRLYEPLRQRDNWSSEIERLRTEEALLLESIAIKEESAAFEGASEWLSAGFNRYLTAIRRLDGGTWTKAGAVSVRINERRATFLIDGKPAKNQIGGTLQLYFIFAYHYALLTLVRKAGTHFPGLAVMDLFPDIAKGPGMRDRIKVVLKPFSVLAVDPKLRPLQIIASAREFPATLGVTLLRMTQAWR